MNIIWSTVAQCLTRIHLSLLNTGSTKEDPSRHNWKIVDWDVKNQIKYMTIVFKDIQLYIAVKFCNGLFNLIET